MKRTLIAILTVLFATSVFAGEVGRRQVHQQKRIAQGVKSGQLTPGETANLEHKEGKIQKEKVEMRKDDGGKLTTADKAKLNHQENQVSRDIYRKKHNAKTTH